MPFVDLTRQYSIHQNEWVDAFKHVAESGRFIGGEEVSKFEEKFASYCGCKHGVGMASGSDALRLTLLALGIGKGDEVITVSHTFVSTVDAIVHAGAKPVFVDIEPETMTLDPEKAQSAMGPKVKAIIPVHLYGQPSDLTRLTEICESADVSMVQDSAQAHGARYDGRPLGSFGQATCYSFYPSKNLGAFGDGGFVATNDDALADKLQLLRQYGERRKYQHELIGYNSRLDTINAVILARKLEHLERWNGERRNIARRYQSALQNISGLVTPTEGNKRHHVYHIYAIRIKQRDHLRQYLAENGIETGVHYPTPVHRQPAYSEIKFRTSDLSETDLICDELISLPMFPELSLNEVDFVTDSISAWDKKK